MKKQTKKLSLGKMTISNLDAAKANRIVGGLKSVQYPTSAQSEAGACPSDVNCTSVKAIK